MSKKINMTGWIMREHNVPDSRLTVLKEVEPHITKGGVKQAQYLCQCECGNQIVVKGANLRKGNTKSCGCLAKEKLIQRNIESGTPINIGDRFGKLVVIKDLGMRKQKSRNKNWRWSLCQCDCGSEPIEVANNLLKNGHKISCGCVKSLGETIIKDLLIKEKINFIEEFSFSDCVSPSGNLYRFDFAILDEKGDIEFLIEFDGRQHFTGPDNTWKKTRTLAEIQEADYIKNQYCINKQIVLKRIPYYQISKITIDNLYSDKFNISSISAVTTQNDSDNLIKLIIEDLINTTDSKASIARKYGVSLHKVGSIDQGKYSYYNSNIEYPIRITRSFSKLKLLQIIDDIINTNLTLKDIGKKYGISQDIMTRINQGNNNYQLPQFVYPLRQ